MSWGDFDGGISWDADKRCPRNFTTNPADAFEVLNKCLDYLHSRDAGIEIIKWHKGEDLDGPLVYHVTHDRCMVDPNGEAQTLPLAICLFAKKLFAK